MLQEDAGQHEPNDRIDSQLQKRFDSPATFFGSGNSKRTYGPLPTERVALSAP
jgi:hypothetical protein